MIKTAPMRFSFLILPALAACDGGGTGAEAAREDDRIECRIGAATSFERVCTIEQAEGAITIRKPDGGFRRLVVTDDGRGVAAADGAEEAIVTIIDDGRIDVAIGGDNFRLPATVRR